MGFWTRLGEAAGRQLSSQRDEFGGLGGPLGWLLGLFSDRQDLDSRVPDEEPRDPSGLSRSQRSVAFTIGAIALSAKMAKADGRVTVEEVAAFRRLFEVPEDEQARVARVYNLARQDVRGFDSYARQLGRLFKDEPGVLEELIDCLFAIARADGDITPLELDYLEEVARLFGMSEICWRRIRAANLPADQDAYAILGVDPAVDEKGLRTAWLNLVQSHHPDRLIAEGLPSAAVGVATEKLAAINRA